MRGIFVLDPSILSDNLGDQIIAESILEELRNIFPDKFITRGYTHESMGPVSRSISNSSAITFVGGTNLLSSCMDKYAQWKVDSHDYRAKLKAVLFGVGWWQYQERPNAYTRKLLCGLLDSEYYHSVRDQYTKCMLESMGIKKVLNTGCPTIWGLNESTCSNIPETKSDTVVFTLTDYKKEGNRDLLMLDAILKNYEKVYFWPQGPGDLEYLKELVKKDERISVLSPHLESLKKLLSDSAVHIDYIGTRLHAGILALNYMRRTIIISVDNRAREMGKDFQIPVIHQENLDKLDIRIKDRFVTRISIPSENIRIWKAQFLG